MSTRTACLAGAAAMVLTAAACSSSSSSGGSSSASSSPSIGAITDTPALKTGGDLTVLEGDGYSGDWVTLDPASNVDGSANQDFMEAIYGQLFELGPKGQIEPDLATSYSFSKNAETVTINLRHGVKFSDGTPFNAQAVYYNWMRDFGPVAVKSTQTLANAWGEFLKMTKAGMPAAGDIVVTSPYQIVVHQIVPNAAFIDDLFDSIATWIVSPTAVQKEGQAKFETAPVGAGPFTVVSDATDSELVLKKNPDYWEPGHPYLDEITFKSVSGDEAAYESMLAGQGQVYEDLSTTSLLDEAGQHFQELNQLGTSPYDLQLNTAIAPFNNIEARQAIYAATDFTPILKAVFGDRYPMVEGFTGPGGLCYEPTVPGYQGYDPTLAKKLVAESGLDKVTFDFDTISSSPVALETLEALKSEWAAFGIKVNIATYTLQALIAAFEANSGKSWQAMIQTAGAYDPSSGVGVGFRFASTSLFSGVHSTALDTLLAKADSSTDTSVRCSYYDQAAEYIAKNYDGPFYFAFSPANISVKGVVGPGLTTPLPSVAVTPTIPWEDVYYNPSSS